MGNESSQLEDEKDEKVTRVAAKQLSEFDHAYKAFLHTVQGPALTVYGHFSKERIEVSLTCTSDNFQLELDALAVGDRKKATIPYVHVTEVGFDHDRCEVKFTISDNSTGGGEKPPSSILIMEIPNLVEFEHEIKLRFSNLTGAKVPPVSYVGMFAGSTKPKPFQRKRPNISTIPSGKLPPLNQMRETAFSRHNGSYSPCPPGESRRMQLAVQHIFEGRNTFPITSVEGGGKFNGMWNRNSILAIKEDQMDFLQHGVDSQPVNIPFNEISSWEVSDNEKANQRGVSGIFLNHQPSGGSSTRIYFGFKYVRDVKHTLEFFWNKHQIEHNRPVMPGSTHGRPLETVYTLSGEEPAPGAPQGSQDIVDVDNRVVTPGQKVFVGNRTQIKGHKHISIGGPSHDSAKLPHENKIVKEHWRQVVKHQGWLLKQGGISIGATKKWQKRYFVLYSTSQGHLLVYYADLLECPMYNTEHAGRNVVDMAKAVFIRPGSTKHPDTPAHSFDLVTIEREFTLCAETQENMQKWLHMLTRAVDEDVAILPDENLMFKVKAKVDPLGLFNPMDYNTHVMVSANCVNVTSPQTELLENGSSKCTWIYTDFYKWSLIAQNHKMALMVSVFSDETFKRRLEFHFRTKEAVRLATAIEFFIEKFMSVMHIMLEMSPGAEVEEPKKEVPEKLVESIPVPEINLLDMSDDAPPPPKPDGISSDFNGDSFFSTPFTGGSGSLSDDQVAQHKVWLQNARLKGGGPLYDDGSVQIACKLEVRGSQGRLTLFFHNKSTVNNIESLTVSISETDGFLRCQFGPLSSSLAPGSQVEQQVMIECMKPSDVNPSLSISYRESGGQIRTNDLTLPLYLTLFNDPLSLNYDDFNNRWQMLTGPGQEASGCIIRTSPLSDDQATQIFEKVMKFSRVVYAGANCLCGAASLRTGATSPGSSDKITLGCLIKIENNGATINVTCRTVHAAATAALVSFVKHLLSE